MRFVRAVGRCAIPVLVALAGISLVTYGAGFHSMSILVEQQITLTLPSPFDEAHLPPLPPLTVTELVSLDASEPDLIQEVTVGGVARTDAGELKRTYTGLAPAQCPT